MSSLVSTPSLGRAQSTLYTDQASFTSATAAVALEIPASSNFFNPFPQYNDAGCVSNLIGFDIPMSAPKLNVWAPAAIDWICIVGPNSNLPPENTFPLPTSNAVTGNGEDDFILDFDPPIVALGLNLVTNSVANHTITITYTDGTTQVFTDASLLTGPNQFEFVGFKSTKPIDKVLFDGDAGGTQNELIQGILAESLPSTCVVAPSGLAGWWAGDDTAFNRIAGDDGVFVSGNTYTDGKVGRAFYFDGVDDYVQIPSDTSLDNAGDITVELWLRPDVLPGAGTGKYLLSDLDVTRTKSQGSLTYAFGPSNANVGYYHKHTDGSAVNLSFENGSALVAGRWHHIAYSRDDTAKTVKVYVDGQLHVSGAYAGKTIVPASETGTWTIGRMGDNSDYYVKGAVDELSVYHRALTAEEIRTVYQAGRAGKCFDAIAPVADAGPDQSIHVSQPVQLDGTASYDDTTLTANLEYSWTLISKPAGSSATLTGADTATPTFFADSIGEYEVELVVVDAFGNSSDPDIVKVSTANLAPTANAGHDQIVIINSVAALDGLASTDPDNDPLSYSWTIVSAPPGSVALLVGDDTATPSLTPDLAGSYTIQLIVNDGFASSLPDTVTVSAITGLEFAEVKLQEVSAQVLALPAIDFDAPGHRDYFVEMAVKITEFLQASEPAKAQKHLAKVIERTDGYALREQADPKGGTPKIAGDYLLTAEAQALIYPILVAALAALET